MHMTYMMCREPGIFVIGLPHEFRASDLLNVGLYINVKKKFDKSRTKLDDRALVTLSDYEARRRLLQ